MSELRLLSFLLLSGPLRLFMKKEKGLKKANGAGDEMKSKRRPDSTVSGVQV